MQKIYHKKNELFEVEFYKDKEYTEAFDFMNAKNLYIDGLNGDLSPLIGLDLENINFYVYTPYLPKQLQIYTRNIKTLDEITPNLSKYIPEDNAVLFLSLENERRYGDIFQDVNSYYTYPKIECEIEGYSMPRDYNKATIFLPHGIQTELEKAIEIAKELKEIYGVKEVNLFVLHWFYKNEDYDVISFLLYNKIFNKIITTNSTGILPVQNSERLQVIDCKEIFEEYLKTER